MSNLRDVIAAWRRAEADQKLLEQEFSTSTCNLGGAHCERFEYRAENIQRTTNSTIPAYNAISDPHLVKYRQRIIQAVKRAEAPPKPGKAARLKELGAPSYSHDAAEAPPIITPPLGTEHILQVKRLFWRWSVEMHGTSCRSPYCCVQTVGIQHEHVRLLPTMALNLHRLVCKGVDITNSFCGLHQKPTLSHPTMALVYDWLMLLDCLQTVDWASFLLMCTCNLQREWALIAQLRNAYDCFIQQRPPISEDCFRELLTFLHYNFVVGKNRKKSEGPELKLTSFFQSGDFYLARHICSFAEAVFCLLPRTEQFYLYKANARGNSLMHNFCGRTCITAANRPSTAPEEEQETCSLRAKERHSRIMRKPLLSKQQFLDDQVTRTRFHRRVWL